MKRSASLTLFLLILSVIAGVMLSNASWVGKVGMGLFYKEYEFLKIWWKGAALIFLVLMGLYGVQSLVQKNASKSAAKIVHIFTIVLAFVGLYFSYLDFRKDFSHRLLGERFHIGVYLFWIGWIVISIYLLLTKKNIEAEKDNVGVEV